jgi:hypothetical protein
MKMKIGLRVNKALFDYDYPKELGNKYLEELKKKYKDGWIFAPEIIDILTERLDNKDKAIEIINEWDKEINKSLFHMAKDKSGKVRLYLTKITAKEKKELTGDEIPDGDILELEKAFGESNGGWDDIQKALSHKYIRKIPKPNGGKGWYYIYYEAFKKPLLALKTIFGLKTEKIDRDYEKHNIQKTYGADKKTFAAHILEYLSNRLKWNTIFSKKGNREKYTKPVKQKDITAAAGNVKHDTPASKDKTPAPPKEKPALIVNRSLMRKVWEIHNPVEAGAYKIVDERTQTGDNAGKGAENGGKDNIGTGSPELRDGSGPVWAGGSEGTGNSDLPGAGSGTDEGESGISLAESGKRSGNGNRGRSAIRDVRERVKKLLAGKSDGEMTEEDKTLLRQYEGAGGLAEENASAHGILYEFYTPQKVIDKVWSLVDKYDKNINKTVIEPSAGTGRFAEGRRETFSLFELDETSARIAGILHPDAEVKQGAFQELFIKGKSPQKKYGGKLYDVAIGNPPYGAYSGIYRGMGEGKEHTRIEEYFIDRSLDTLKDGGILAMVVPSSFLRGKNSKAKEKIAGKAKILEAWRLPNGTFGTTGVGTDIIVLRKEPGNAADYSDNAYFEDNERNIAGIETERTGRFGPEKYVTPMDGMGFDEALEMIQPAKIPYTPNGEKTPDQKTVENIEVKASEAEKHENRSQAMMGNDNAAGDRGGEKDEPKKNRTKKTVDEFIPSTGKNMTAEEFNKKYSRNVDTKDIPIWKQTDYTGRVEISRLSDKDRVHLQTSGNFAVDGSGNWYSVVNYASGNIYEKLAEIERDKQALGEKNYAFNKSLLEAVLPHPKKAENIVISPISDFAKEYTTEDKSGNDIDLREAFFKWANVRWGTDFDNSPISKHELPSAIDFTDIRCYIEQIPVRMQKSDGDDAKLIAETKRIQRRECAEHLFNRFIREGMTEEHRNDLENAWNKRFNAHANPDYKKIPVFIEGMNTHKGVKEFNLLDRQVEGISFLCNNGNGILVHEVGLGKTVQAEAATVNQIQTGRAKKPFVCVPKSVYTKWVNEFRQHFPDLVVNELGNFSDKNLASFRTEDGGLNIMPGSVSVCTYEALEKISFTDETIDNKLVDDIMDSQTIYDGNTEDTRSERDKAKDKENIMERLGKGITAKDGAVFWEKTGFDHITVDEIHNFKNVFGKANVFTHSNKDAKTGGEMNSNEFGRLAVITPSARAVKLFAITQLVQRENEGRNVFGLSATPFNNSPIEVYNLLSLVAREKLKELHIFNMHEFLAEFAELNEEWTVDAKGEITTKSVMKKFNNLSALQNLITEYMDYVSADEAGTVRPRKKPHLAMINLNPMQKAIIAAETDRMTNADPREDPGAYLGAINNMRMAVLSPASVDPKNFERYRGWEGWPENVKDEPKSSEFVTSSPKMTFVCDSVSQAWKESPAAGQIIYLPKGVNDFAYVKEYLVSRGMPIESIQFMHSKTTLDEKERIKNDFNDPDGKCKVIIGSETIKEGVSLNGNTHSIYNTMLGWNPTEMVQVEGRAWRQGNAQGHVHIIYPLMNDSIDSLMYQKADEKSSRINAIWNLRGADSIDVQDINPAELKFDLIKDPKKKARFKVGLLKEEVKNNQRIEEAKYEVLYKDNQLLERTDERLPGDKRNLDVAEADMMEARAVRDEAQKKLDKASKNKENNRAIEEAKKNLENAKWKLERETSFFREKRKIYKEAKETEESILSKFRKQGIKPAEVEKHLKEISVNIQKYKAEINRINGNMAQYEKEAAKEIAESQIKSPPLRDMIKQNVRSIMDNLRPMKVVKEEITTNRDYKAGKITREQALKQLVDKAGHDKETAEQIVKEWEKTGTVGKSFVFYHGKLYLKTA